MNQSIIDRRKYTEIREVFKATRKLNWVWHITLRQIKLNSDVFHDDVQVAHYALTRLLFPKECRCQAPKGSQNTYMHLDQTNSIHHLIYFSLSCTSRSNYEKDAVMIGDSIKEYNNAPDKEIK